MVACRLRKKPQGTGAVLTTRRGLGYLQEKATEPLDWAASLREVALDLSPLIADKELDFDTAPAPVLTHGWMLRALSRNLLHKAIRYSPAHGRLLVRLLVDASTATLVISESGPGISEALRKRLFSPSRRVMSAAAAAWD